MPKTKHDLPADLQAGNTVIYHLPRNWYIGDNPHRVAVVSGVYLDDNDEVAVDLIVFLQTGDGAINETLLPVACAVYDPDCPRGTFCLQSDSEDELQTVGELRGDKDATNTGAEVSTPQPSPVQVPVPDATDTGTQKSGGGKKSGSKVDGGSVVTDTPQTTNNPAEVVPPQEGEAAANSMTPDQIQQAMTDTSGVSDVMKGEAQTDKQETLANANANGNAIPQEVTSPVSDEVKSPVVSPGTATEVSEPM